MNKNGLVDQRRKVYSALALHLKQDRLLEALWLWEQKYALSTGLELRKYVSELMTENDSPQLKSAIYKSLTKLTYFTGDSELLPDPYNEMQKYRERCNGAFKFINASYYDTPVPFSTVVFQQVMDSILTQARRNNNIACQHIIYRIKNSIPGMELNDAQLKELKSWLDKKNNYLRLLYSEQFMSKCISSLYINCCDKFGPVPSDKILARAISDAEELPESQYYNPRKLL